MRNAKPGGWAAAQEGSIVIEGKLLKIPGHRIVKEAGRGANAVVFQAIDESLQRNVAVKVWNSRGTNRAQPETAKIAQFNHPLIVATYQFGEVEGHPYAVMEFVAGSSGKVWLSAHPPVHMRVLAWKLYSRSLRFIHQAGEIHGDPHLGNVLILEDPGSVYGNPIPYRGTPMSIKLADAGTSEFWADQGEIRRRESKLIVETAHKLFEAENIGKLWFHPPKFCYQASLAVLDSLCDCVSKMNDMPDYDRRSDNADQLADLTLKTPLLELDEMAVQIENGQYTSLDRFARRLNQRLFGKRDLFDAEETLGANTKAAYAMVRKKFIDERTSDVIGESCRD